ncbi:MAG: phage tail protein [Methylococcaceae bacterium]
MNIPDFLPPLPQPPHDPTSWLLDAGEGWQDALLDKKLEKTPIAGSLAFAPEPDSIPALTGADGSFGGLTVPANVTLVPDGTLFLLDAATLELKRFDRCECAFATVPCFGGEGGGARQLKNPHGIATGSGNIYVCDTGNFRLSVFSLHGFVLRGHWHPPKSKFAYPFEPFSVAVDSRGRIFVSDSANSCIHRFGSHGHWETSLSGFGQPVFLAMDCLDWLYVAVEGVEREVLILDGDGKELGVASRVEALMPQFPRLPFVVDAQGNLHLGSLCAVETTAASPCITQSLPTVAERGVFDLNGKLVASPKPPTPPAYPKQGFYISSPLDSALYRCQWHRIILSGDIPPGTRLVVSTYTAEAILTDTQIQAPELAWETRQNANAMPMGDWDCLVRSGGGRYLWLRLEFVGNGKATPIINSIIIEFPRISLRRYLPAVFGMEPISADFTDRFLGLFDTSLRSIETKLDNQARYFDPLSTPAERNPKTGVDFLSWLASWIGVSMDQNWSETKRRLFLKRAGKLFDLRGTREGLRRQLLLLLDMEADTKACPDTRPKLRCCPKPANCAPPEQEPDVWQPPLLILEHYQLRRWLFVGAGRLGDQAILWGKRIVNRSQLNEGAQVGQTQLKTTQDPYRDPFYVYAHKFTVFVPARFGRSDKQRKSLENLLKAETPAHTQYQIEYVEPGFRIGVQAMIGFDAVIGRPIREITLDATPLGSASLLGKPAYDQGDPAFQLGREGHIGITTRLG